MKKVLIFLLITFIIIILLWLFTPFKLIVTMIPCGLSPSCVLDIDSKEVEKITSQAISSQNVEMCNKLPKEIWFSTSNPRGDCYLKYALAKKDAEICLRMKQLKLTSAAVEIEGGIIISGGLIECYIGVARLRGDSAMCSRLGEIEPTLRDAPDKFDYNRYLLMCYGGVAQKLQDKSICNNLDGEDKLWCLVPFSNRSICEEFSERNKGFCNEWFDNHQQQKPL